MRKKTIKILKIIAIVLVALSLIYAIAIGVSSAKLRKAYAALEKAGRPMKPADVIPPDVPDAENAALLYQSAILLLKAQPAPNGNLLEYLGKLSDKFITESIEPDELAELQQLIGQDAVTQALSIVEQGIRRRSCRLEHDYKAGFNMLMPNLSSLRNLTRIIGAKACFQAEAGRPDAAWDLVLIQLRFADAQRNEPILISQLVRFASIRTSCQTIQKICEVALPNPEQYRSIESMLSDYEDRKPLILALDGERLLGGEWAFNILRSESPRALTSSVGEELGLGEVLLRLYSAFKPLSLADHAAYVRIMGRYTESAQQPYPLSKAGTVDNKVEQMQSRLHIVTSIIIPALGRVIEIYCERTTQMRITRAGLAVLQERTARGAFPDSLEKLQLKNLDDPFSAEPLHLKLHGQGFILYSVGPDQKDDDGSPRQKKQKDDWDIVWSYAGGR
jgi:hypothetical protein